MENTHLGAFVGGHPALDFTNTVGGSSKNREKSRIGNWEQFQSWLGASEILPKENLKQLETISKSSFNSTILDEIHKLRESTYSVLSSRASGDIPPAEDQAFIETQIKIAIGDGVLNYRENICGWTIAVDHPNWLIGTLALSIENLIRSKEFGKLRECGRCSWLFLDLGRGRGRKWCDMRTCGNRAKSETFKNRWKE